VRVACVWLPHFPIAIERRNSPALNRRAVIIGETAEQRSAVLDCSAEAEGQGVRVGMPLRQALSLCPSASFLPPDLPRYGDSFDQILRALETMSPLVDPVALGCAFIGLGGLNGHHRDEMALGDALAQAVRQASGLMPSVGLAEGKFTAQVAATVSAPGEVCLVPKGQEKKFLAPIDVSLLLCSRDTLRRLGLLGLRTMGDLASLPAGAVQAQFGSEGRRIWELAHGVDREPLRPLHVLAMDLQAQEGDWTANHSGAARTSLRPQPARDWPRCPLRNEPQGPENADNTEAATCRRHPSVTSLRGIGTWLEREVGGPESLP